MPVPWDGWSSDIVTCVDEPCQGHTKSHQAAGFAIRGPQHHNIGCEGGSTIKPRIFRSFLLAALAALPCAAPAEFRAAAVKVEITPDRPQWLLGYAARRSTGVHDPLYHRVLAMDDGKTQFFLASTDIALVSPAFYDEFCEELNKQTGIRAGQVWWAATHTHSAPEVGPPGLPRAFLGNRYDHEPDWEYARRVKTSLIDSIREARAKLAPARLSVGVTTAMANINRRARDAEGRIWLGMNPEGPVDRQVGLIRLERPDGSLIALVANYAMHGTVLGGANTLISGDAPGIVAGYVEEKLNAPVLFLNGAAGDIAPIYSVYPDFKSSHINEFKVLLGDRILAGNRAMGPATSKVSLRAAEKVLETPLKSGLTWPDELQQYAAAGGVRQVRLPLRFLRINDTGIWAAPLELFCEIAMDIRNQSPFARTFYFGYTNGWLGYMPTRKAFPEGGYETTVTPFTGEAEASLKKTVLTALREIRR